MANKKEGLMVFLEQFSVFTLDEFREYFSIPTNSREAYDVILQSKRMGRIGRIKEGLYFSVRPGKSATQTSVDPYLIASKLSPDAVLAYHTALEMLGVGHSIFHTLYYYSARYYPVLRFQDREFRAVMTPINLRGASNPHFATERVERLGSKVRVSARERTIVVALERPQYCGGFEEMYRSLEKIPYIRTDDMLKYLEVRRQKKLYALTGFFLEQHRHVWRVDEAFLKKLAARVPVQPVYWTPTRKGGVLSKRWKLIVPQSVIRRTWEDR